MNDSRMSWPWFDCRSRFVAMGAVAVAALLIVGCAATPVLRSVDGAAIDAPSGFVVYCASHPERVECGGFR